MEAIVPKPVSVTPASGTFAIGPATRIAASGDLAPVGRHLAGLLRRATHYPVPVTAVPARAGDIALELGPTDMVGAGESYELTVARDHVPIAGTGAAGALNG